MAITLDGTNGVTAPNVFGRNLIINGQGRINQRGYTSGTATTAANQFTLDRWFVVTSGQNLAFTGGVARRVMTAPAGGVSQVIEGSSIVGGSYVLNWDGTATATVNGVARSKGEVFSLTDSSNATVTFAGGTFTDVQLEAGLVPTPFERVSIGDELSRCQRYYYRNPSVNLSSAWGALFNTTSGRVWAPLPVTMRAIPALTVETNIFHIVGFGDVTGTLDGVVLSTHSVSFDGTSLSTAGFAGQPFAYARSFQADAELTS